MTLAELLVVTIIIGVVSGLAFPRFSRTRDAAAVRIAKQRVATSLAVARAAAIRRGLPAQFRIQQSQVLVTVTPRTGTMPQTIGTSARLDGSYAVTVTRDASTAPVSLDSIVFDSRGLASNLTGRVLYRFTRNQIADSLCVSRLGLVARDCDL